MQIKNGSKINIDKVGKNLNIRANVHSPLDPSLVKFDYDGRHFNNEKTEPFALAGDVNGKYNAWMPSFGRHWVEVMVFKSDGRFAGRKRVSFTVVSDQGSTDNISLTLVNTSNSNKPVDLFELEERKENTIDLSRTGNALNIRVDVNRKVWHKYVVFYWQRQYYDPQKRIEKRIPYYFYGDRNGKPVSWKPPLGKIYLTVAVVDKNNKAMFSTTTRLNIIK